MTRLVRTLAVVSGILFPVSTFAQNAVCGAHPEDPTATIAACTAAIKQIQHHTTRCNDELIWAASTRARSIPYLPATMTTPSPECSGYPPPLPGISLEQALYSRADAYFAKGKFDPAIDDYDAAGKVRPLDATQFYHRALAYHGLKNESHAVDDFTNSIKLDSSNPVAWADRCRSRAILGKLPQALSDCNTSIQMLRNYAAAYKARGLVYLKSGQFALARDNFDDAIKLSKPTAVSLYGRGLAKSASGDAAGAAADTSAAVQLNPAVAAIFKRYRVRLK